MKLNKYKKKLQSIILGIVILIICLVLDRVGLISIEELDAYRNTTSSENVLQDNNYYKVVRVVDGDTIVIDFNGVEEKLRLIGVDTPESVHPSEEKNTKEGIKVSDYTKKMLESKSVMVEFDVQERDKYGRLLAYVYIDGRMYNKTLLKEGLAKVATYPPNVKYVEDFTALQKEARENKEGLWAY